MFSAMSEAVDSLIAYCRENNRVCSLPQAWQLWEMMPERRLFHWDPNQNWDPRGILMLRMVTTATLVVLHTCSYR